MNAQIVTVNLIPDLCAPAVVRVSQYDVGRPLTFKVLDGTGTALISSSATATVTGTKPSGLGFSVSATLAGNTVTLDTTLAMTQECGKIPAEIRFTQTGEDIGTANFILAVEPSPHPEGTTDGTQESMANLETRLQGQIDALDTRVDALEAGQGGGSGLTDDIKTALLQIAQKVAYIDAHGQDYYDDLYDALYSSATRSVLLVLSHVSSSNTTNTVEDGDSYTTTLTASTNYTLNTVSVTMGGVDVTATTYSSGTITIPNVTGNIVITATAVLAAQSITAVYTQSGAVYDTDTLDSLKTDLVVTANYSGGTSETVPASDYTLSGTLTVGTSTITVSYAGLTDTFSVTVSQPSLQYTYNWDFTQSLTDSVQGVTLSPSGATRDSSGLHFSGAANYVLLSGLGVSGNCFELDIASVTRQGSQHGRVFIMYQGGTANSGFIYRSTGKWAVYSSNSTTWTDSSITSTTALDGKTVTIKLLQNSEASYSNKLWMYVYVDGNLIADGSMGNSSNGNLFLGSDNGQCLYNMTITGLRMYTES